MSRRIRPTRITAPFRSVTFPFHRGDSLQTTSTTTTLLRHDVAERRRSLSADDKLYRGRGTNKLVPIRTSTDSMTSKSHNAKTPMIKVGGRSHDGNTPIAARGGGADSVTNIQLEPEEDWNKKWIVTDDMLEPLPDYYPIERPLVITLSAQVVSERILNFLKEHSIAHHCEGSCCEDSCSLECTTNNLTRFGIHLWKRRQKQLVVEIQRLQGSCIEMHRIRNELFHSIMTGKVSAYHEERPIRPVHCTVDCIAKEQRSQRQSRLVKESLEMALQLLSSPCLDQNLLGMQSLYFLVNPTAYCDHDCVEKVSHELLFGTDIGPSLRNILVKYFENVDRPTGIVLDNEYEQGTHFGDMHHVALQVLVKALQVVEQEKGKPSTMNLLEKDDFFQRVSEALWYDLSVAEHRPQEAALSATCLTRIMDLFQSTDTQEDSDKKVVSIASHAHEYGKVHHLQLERSTQNLLERLVLL